MRVMLAKNSEIHWLPQSRTWQQLDIKALWPHSTHHISASRYAQCMLSFCCRKSWNKANWKRSFKFMILILTWCNLQFFHNGRFETILFTWCPCMWFLLNVLWCLIGARLAIKWTTLTKHICNGKGSTTSYFQRKCFFILNLIAESWWNSETDQSWSAGKIQELGYPSDASALHPESSVPHLCNIFWIGGIF